MLWNPHAQFQKMKIRNLSTTYLIGTRGMITSMELTLLFTTIFSAFAVGYLFGHRDLHFEKILISLSDFKKNIIDKFTPRQKVVILNSKDELPPPEDSE